MSCESCDCEKSEILEGLNPLFSKLERANFSGELRLTFQGGVIGSAELRHLLPFSEIGRNLPVIESEEFSLKP